MGKHKKHKKEKKHKDKKHKRRHSSSSSEDEWVEKKRSSSESSPEAPADKAENAQSTQTRDDWMTLAPTSFLTASNLDRRREREEKKKLERERQQYNPSECARELNPYWKDGGDGLPSFKKPVDDDDDRRERPRSEKSGSSRGDRYNNKIRESGYGHATTGRGNWRKKMDTRDDGLNGNSKSSSGCRGESPGRDGERDLSKSRGSPARGRGSLSRSRESPSRRGGSPSRRGGGSPRRGGSPPRRGESPPRRGGSTLRRGGSPPRRGGSPPRRGGSPPRRGGSPPRRGGSPPRRGGSPSRSKGSPSRRGGIPFRNRGSPSRIKRSLSQSRESPRHRDSPSRSRGSPSRNRGSPSRNRGIPPRSRGSPFRSRGSSSESRQSSSPESRQDEGTPEKEEKFLSDAELNVLASKLVKAEIMGNTQLINELKAKLEKARKLRESGRVPSQEEEVVLTHTDSRGQARPVRLQSEYGEPSGSKKKKQKVETHRDGERMRYFADDDRYSLKQMFENERYNTIEDQNSEFIRMAGKIRKNDDMDEVFADSIRHKESDGKVDARNRDRAIGEHQKVTQSLDNCRRCLQSDVMPKHLMVSMHESVYLSLPPHEPLTDGHCSIAPIRHVPCATQLDENEWTDTMDVRKALVRLFASRNEDVVFFETALHLNRYPHMALECVPLPREEGDMAPIYFKKAIDESETEWAQNKKLVSMKGKDVRKCVPKGLPYFSVSFGMEEGYAHVIEDEETFPANFAQEIIGGMLDLHHSKWRRPKNQSFEEQSKRVLQFSKEWSKYDCSAKC